MCEIQFIQRKDGKLNAEDVAQMVKLLELGSRENPHAFGIFNKDYTFKRAGLLDLRGFEADKLLNQNYVIGHNRLTTSGEAKNNFNNHPFKHNGFIMCHNGVLFGYQSVKRKHEINHKIETDSYVLLQLISKFYEMSKERENIKRVCEAIQKATAEVTGSLSIMLIDVVNDNIFYFKNGTTTFNFWSNDKILIGATQPDVINYIYQDKDYIAYDWFNDLNEIEIKDNIIYQIKDGVLNEVGSFESPDIKDGLHGFFPYELNEWEKDIVGIDRDVIKYPSKFNMDNEEIEEAFINLFGIIPEYLLRPEQNELIIITRDKDIQQLLKPYKMRGIDGCLTVNFEEFINDYYDGWIQQQPEDDEVIFDTQKLKGGL